VTASLSPTCHAFVFGADVSVTGGVQSFVVIDTPAKWCEYYGVVVENGIAVLYKAVLAGFASQHDASLFYRPGTVVEAMDWDGGKAECGGGLHFSPCVAMTKEFVTSPVHYLACPVALADMVVHPEGSSPQKCKARRLCAPCWEVDADGLRILSSKNGAA